MEWQGSLLKAAFRFWSVLLCAVTLVLVCPAELRAQTFQAIPALSFTKTVNSTSNPLPQVITVASSDGSSSMGFSVSVVSGTGGNWLSTSINGGTYYTAHPIVVTVSPDVSLAAGFYTAQIVIKGSGSVPTLTVPVSLTIEPTSATYFDELPGAATFSMKPNSTAPPAQILPIRNAGTGTLDWTASTSTADGGNWLALSASSGAAPYQLRVGVVPNSLPERGTVAGTYIGQVLLTTGGDTISVPVTVTVGSAILAQINPLNFTKTLDSTSNPLSQVITAASTDGSSSLGFSVTSVAGTGGNWLSTSINGGTYYSSRPIIATVSPDVTLTAGTYTSEIIVANGSQAIVVPVTLAVEQTPAGYFDELNGELTFSMQPGGTAPPAEQVQLRNAGSGTLTWTASTSTADGGSWLALSANSGAAPYTLSVSIIPTNLPERGTGAGTFSGQVLLQTNGDSVSIPVTVTIGHAVLAQINPLTFTKTINSTSNPLSQVINVASTDGSASIGFSVAVVNGTGGSWLSTSINGGTYYTSHPITVTAAPDVSLAAGTYTAEIILANGSQSVVIPVTLTVASSISYFDALPGQVTFSMQPSGKTPPAELVQIRNASTGTLNWTASTSTADGGDWLALSATSGTAPYLLNVSINSLNLPERGALAGTFSGQILLQTGGDTVTIPVTVTVGTAVLAQINPLNFTQTLNSTSNPLPQVITVSSTDGIASIGFSVSVVNGTGGSWLSTSINGGTYYTSRTITVTAAPDVSLQAGTYTAEIILANGSQSVVVPVTLTVEPSSATYFDSLPGALTFSSQATGAAIGSQSIAIRNAGPSTLNWMALVSTADGGNWLSLSAASGTAPSTLSVNITPASLPNRGKIAGTFTGQVMLQAIGDIVTIPVTVTIGDSVFNQLSPISFNKNYAGANPDKQSVTLTSTDASIGFSLSVVSGTGGNWLTSSINGGTYYTDRAFTLSATPISSLAAGVYSAEVIISNGSEPSVIPVTLTVGSNTQAAATPTFSPAGGTYASAQSVTISDAAADAAIYYTTDGSQPTLQSALYTGPVKVTASGTLRAMAVGAGYTESAVASATYTIAGGECVVIDNSGGFTGTGLSLNGGAALAGKLLQLTDGGFDEARSVFSSSRVPVDSFITDFTFQLLDAYAEGFTFAIQGDGPQVIGASGGGLGYQGIANSLAVKLDLFDTGGEGYNSTGIYLNGAAPTVPAIDLGQAGMDLHNGHVFAAHLAYVNGVYQGSITDTVTGVSASMSLQGYVTSLGETAYVGFTAGTSAEGSATQNILTWKYQGGSACGH